MSRRDRRFQRQFEVLSRIFPPLRRPLAAIRRNRWILVRLPLGIILTLGGVLWFLPILGIWMLPVGLLLLAVDLPQLRSPISVLLIRARRRINVWRCRWRARNKPLD